LEFIKEILPLLKFLLIFVVIVFLIVRRLNLAAILGGGAVAMGLFFGMKPLPLLESIGAGAIDLKTIKLLGLVYGIITFSVTLRETGYLKKFIASVERLIPSFSISTAMVPALIGLLPMPGGAIFSAPMLAELTERRRITPEQNTFINHWFRHVWEYMLPLYPGVIMASAMWDISVRSVVIFQSPLTLFSIIAGFVVVLLAIKVKNSKKEGSDRSSIREFMGGLWPFILIVGGVVFLPVDILIVVWCMMPLLFVVNRLGFKKIGEIFKESFDWKILLLIVVVMVFKRVMENSNGAVEVAESLISLNLPVEVIFFTLPFIVALASGITIAFVGITFPILSPLLATLGGNPIAGMMLAYAGGFLATLLTPLHLCLSLTNEYFKSNLLKTYRYFLPAVGIVGAMTWGYFYLLRMV
jgi:hypothetical protein